MIPLRDVIPSRTTPGVTLTLIASNVLVFFFMSSLTLRAAEAFIYVYGLVPAEFSFGNVLTSMFVHGGLAHMAGNMWFLWIFGDNVEDRLGHGRFIVFYLICGLVAAVSQAWLDPTSQVPMVGASGAIAGVMGAYLVLYPHSRVLMLFPFPVFVYELPAVVFLVLWFVMQFVSGIDSLTAMRADDLTGGVAFWAHVMGFLAGLALVPVMRRRERETVDWWDVLHDRPY
ncbi:MAG: rhomboid family intramembrane serine protease [Vicinamibacterales bacterium]